MRTADNPAQRLAPPQQPGRHRVVVPVYVPALEGYYAQAIDVLDLCLESLARTAGPRAAVSVVSNGSCREVLDRLDEHRSRGRIDQLVINRTNIGKVDAAVSIARASFEPLVTIADCDVLFHAGWLDAVDRLFAAFPECGVASPVPNPGSHCHWYFTSAAILGGLARRELAFMRVVPEEHLDRFARSIGRPDFYPPEVRAAQLVLQRGDSVACVGCGHFVMTLRREAIRTLGDTPSNQLYKAEERWLDAPPDRAGFWRLATTSAYASHMGNVPEPWMFEVLRSLPPEEQAVPRHSANTALPPVRPSRIPAPVRHVLVRLLRRSALIEPRSRWLRTPVGASASAPATLARVD